jgi:hypothetical protein
VAGREEGLQVFDHLREGVPALLGTLNEFNFILWAYMYTILLTNISVSREKC